MFLTSAELVNLTGYKYAGMEMSYEAATFVWFCAGLAFGLFLGVCIGIGCVYHGEAKKIRAETDWIRARIDWRNKTSDKGSDAIRVPGHMSS